MPMQCRVLLVAYANACLLVSLLLLLLAHGIYFCISAAVNPSFSSQFKEL